MDEKVNRPKKINRVKKSREESRVEKGEVFGVVPNLLHP
jgi:hypothetical protein